MPNKKRPDIYGVVAEFDSPEAVLAAAQQVRAAGYRRVEAYTPFAIHGLSEALGFERTGVPIVVLTCGVFGDMRWVFHALVRQRHQLSVEHRRASAQQLAGVYSDHL